jgi:hypothetical protein
MRALRFLMLLAGLSASTTLYAGDVATAPEQAIKDWEQVLDRYVNDRGYVDFETLKKNPEPLIRFTDWVAAVDPAKHPEWFPDQNAKVAHHINAYNALAMRHVLTNNLPKELTALRRLRFFRRSEVGVGGTRMSLEKYENTIIRKLGEHRVHVALNCMSESCPRLPRTPFTAATLDAQLEHESRTFFSETRNVRVDAANRTVYLTEIMKFFPEDFLAVSPSLIAYANQYRSEPIPDDYKVRYTPYDWTIIHQR